MTAGPPSVAIRVVAMLPSNGGISAAGSGEVAGGGRRQVPALPAMAASFTSALATGASVAAAAGAGAAGVSAAGLLCRFFRLCRFGLHRLCRRQRRQFLGLGRTRRPGFDRPVPGYQGLFPERRRHGHSPPASPRPADRRAAAPASAAGRRSGGQTSARAAPVAREGWQIPHARHATGRRRQAQKPGSTSKGRSR